MSAPQAPAWKKDQPPSAAEPPQASEPVGEAENKESNE
jgi:hypothetical protein